MLAQGHVGDVQEPDDPQVARRLVQVGGEPFDRLARAGLVADGRPRRAIGKMQLEGPTHSRQFSISPRRMATIPSTAMIRIRIVARTTRRGDSSSAF